MRYFGLRSSGGNCGAQLVTSTPAAVTRNEAISASYSASFSASVGGRGTVASAVFLAAQSLGFFFLRMFAPVSTSKAREADSHRMGSAGKHWQASLPLIGAVPRPQLLDGAVIDATTFNGTLCEAARYSGLDDQDIAEEMHICAGYMSRFMRGVAQQWAKRLVLFMRTTNSLAPLQWLAEQMGCDVVQRDSRAAELAVLRQRVNELERAA